MQLILASTSRYRKHLPKRLGLPFNCIAPDVDEAIVADETASARQTIGTFKSASVLPDKPVQLASDQVACWTKRLRKPGTADRAVAQLTQCSGKQIRFWTGLSLLSNTGQKWDEMVHSDVTLRHLTPEEIKRYIELDCPLECAGILAESLASAVRAA